MNKQTDKRQSSYSGLILLLAIFAIMGLSWTLFYVADSGIEPAPEETAAQQPVPVAPPDLPSLAQAALKGGNAQPSQEQLEEEQVLEEKQVAFAGELMEKPEAANRAAGAEQLAAYPTVVAERLLVKALATDIDANVRATAAQSLGAIKKPKEESVDALLTGMLDPDRKVRRNAMNTLQLYVARESHGSPRAQKIFDKLGQLAQSPQLQADTLKAIKVFLADQAPR